MELRGVEGELARAKGRRIGVYACSCVYSRVMMMYLLVVTAAAELESADAAYNRAKERVKGMHLRMRFAFSRMTSAPRTPYPTAASIAAATKECPRTLQLLQQQVRTLRKRFTELSSHVDELKAVLETTGEESVPDGATDGTEETEHGVDDELWSRVHALVDWHRAANWTGITNIEGDEEQDAEVKSMPQVVNVPAPNTGGATIGNDDDDAAAPQPPSSIYEQYVRPLYDFMRSLFFGGMVMDDGSYVDLHALKVIADKARATHTTLKTTVSDLQSRQSTLITQRDRNYGPEGVFMKLEGQCVEFAAAEYVYEVCPFGEAVQKTSGGARIALLGYAYACAVCPDITGFTHPCAQNMARLAKR